MRRYIFSGRRMDGAQRNPSELLGCGNDGLHYAPPILLFYFGSPGLES